MTRSKRSEEGLLIIDHRGSPGVPDHWMPGFKNMPVGCGQGLYEVPTASCGHCPQQMVMNPKRRRPRGYCIKCDSYVCDRCHGILAVTKVCKPYEQVLDELQEKVLKEDHNHGGTIISNTNINTDTIR